MSDILSRNIKKIVVEFVILIFIMGFFSTTVANFFLPDINGTQMLENQAFYKSMPINGTIQSKETNRILLKDDIVIRNFFVDVGYSVKIGDPIFEIDKSYGNITETNETRELYLKIENEEFNKEKTMISLELREKEIHKMEETIEKDKLDLDSKIALYEIGSISQAELNKSKDNIKSLEEKLEVEKDNFEVLKKEANIYIKNLENNIRNIRKDIKELNKDANEDGGFYAKVDSDGIYYAEVDGIILSINNTGQILRRESLLTEIAIVNGYDSIKFVGYVDEKDDEFINVGDVLSLKEISKERKLEASVSYKSRVANNQAIKVEAYFNKVNDMRGIPLIGGRLEGKISKEEKGVMVIPKASIIPNQSFVEGQSGIVYVIEEKDGLLGKKYFARLASVTMLKIGDDKVEVTGLEMHYGKPVITNLSYKIRDGVKIKWK